MGISRRDVLLGSAGALGAATLSFPKPAIAQSEPIKIGCLAAMTGPSSAPTIGFNRGVNFAAEAINAAGGVKGRKIEIVMRDTQGDPTKAVNATQEMISQAKVHAIWGPLNSGEALATTPIMARAKMPDIHPCVVESLIDTTKFPNAFRMAPSNSQWDDAVRNYCLNILKVKKVAVIGDTTGYGVTAVGASVAAFKKDGAEVVYQANIDCHPARHDPGHAARQERRRRSDRGLERLHRHGSADVQHPRGDELGRAVRRSSLDVLRRDRRPGREARQLEKSLRHRLQELQLRCRRQAAAEEPGAGRASGQGQRRMNDTLLWWIAGGIDAIELIAKAVEPKADRPTAKASSNTGTGCRNIPAISATTPSRRPSITAIRPKRS